MTKLQILGTGCAKCQKLAAETKAAADAMVASIDKGFVKAIEKGRSTEEERAAAYRRDVMGLHERGSLLLLECGETRLPFRALGGIARWLPQRGDAAGEDVQHTGCIREMPRIAHHGGHLGLGAAQRGHGVPSCGCCPSGTGRSCTSGSCSSGRA